MTLLVNPDGYTIAATGRLETLLLARGYTPTDQPPTPGARLVTAAELDAVAPRIATLEAALSESVADRADLRQLVEPVAQQLPEVATEVDQLTATVEATTTAAAPKPTPRTDALEAWRAVAEPALAALASTVGAIDLPAAVQAWLTANPPPAGQDGTPGSPGADGAPGKDAYEIAREVQGYGGTRTQWLATLKGETGDTGPPGTTDYLQLSNRPNLHAVATTGSYTDLTNKPAIPTTRAVTVNVGALTANTAKTVAIAFPSAMPSTTYAVVATLEVTTATVQQYTVGVLNGSKTVNGCSVVVRSTAAVNAGSAPNLHVIALAP